VIDVISGDPAGVRDLARHWTQQGEAAEQASTTLGSAKNDIQGGTLGLKGDFAPKIQDAIGELPGELRKLAQGYRGCGRALDTFATKLSEAQVKSRQARDDWDAASTSKRNAEYDLDALAPGWDAHAQSPTGLRAYLADKPEPVMNAVTRRESADRDVDLATSLSRQAAALRGDAERDCVREIKDALEDSGLKNRTWYQKVGDYLKESFTTWDGFVKLCENISLVLGVVALFLTGPLALIVGAVLLIAAAVAIADKLKKLADGEIGWGDLAFELGMVVLARFGGRALGPAFRRLATSKAARGLTSQARKGASRLSNRLKFGDRGRDLADRAKCLLTGHPVDIATGKVFTDAVDLALPGPLPLTYERVWYSTSTYAGPLGHGWHHSFDAGLYAAEEGLLYRLPDGRVVDLLPLYPGTTYFDRQERLVVVRDESSYRITDSTGITRRFAVAPIALPAEGGEPVVVHRLVDQISRAGHRISLEYDEAGRLAEIVDSGGRALQFEYDAAGRIGTVTAPHPLLDDERFTVTRYRYDDLGNLISATDALDHVQQYAYIGHLLVQETDRTGLNFSFEYDGPDERARCLHTWGDGGIYDRRLTYEPGRTTVVNSLGHTVQHEHEAGLVVMSVDALGAETRTEYEYQQPVRRIDALGRVTTYEYDYRGNTGRSEDPAGAVIETIFSEQDLPLTAVDPVGGRWSWRYDENGVLQERRDPLGRSIGFGYRRGLLATVTDAAGGQALLDYDSQGALARLVAADGATARWERDRLGREVAAIDPLGNVERRTLDLLGRLVRLEEPAGEVHELTHDGEGYLLSLRNQRHDIRFTRSGMGRMTSRSQAGTTVRFDYDTEEQLTRIVNKHGSVYSFTYTATGELASERGFDEVLRVFERDAIGRVVSVRRASGLVSRYEYDGGDRVVAVRHSDGAGQRFGYRPDGRLMLAENDETSVRLERDLLGRVVREAQGTTWVDSVYDVLGARVGVQSSLGAGHRTQRSTVGDVETVTADGFQARFTRDQLGQELTRELPGGVRARWYRDEQGRESRHEVLGRSATVRDRSYDWGVDGLLRAVVDTVSGPTRYQHDEFAQLLSATAPDRPAELRMPDAVGNLFRTADRSDRRYGPAGQLLESTDAGGVPVRYTYDAEGNLIAKDGPDVGAWRYRWSSDGTLAEVTRPAGSTVAFGYDALGRRVRKTYRGQTTWWVWDGEVPLHEWVTGEPTLTPGGVSSDGRFAQQQIALESYLSRGPPRGTAEQPVTWLFEPETWAPLARSVDGRWESIVTDHLGAPVAMFDADGELTWDGELSVWGDLRLEAGDRWSCPFRWPGQYEDLETGLHYNRFRYYDPESGQYLSQDPIALDGGSKVYAYVGDTTVETDVLGLSRRSAARTVYRELSVDDLANVKAGRGLIPKGTGGSIAEHVMGADTEHISASLTRAGTRRFASGNGLAAIDVDKAIAGGSRYIDHTNVLQAVRRAGTHRMVEDAKSAEEVLFRGHVPADAVQLVTGRGSGACP